MNLFKGVVVEQKEKENFNIFCNIFQVLRNLSSGIPIKDPVQLELELLVDLQVEIILEENHYKSRDIVGPAKAWGIYM